MFDYEAQTFRELYALFEKMVIQEGCKDVKKREEEYNRLYKQRLRMESLEAYAAEKLGAAYNELPEDEKYHPLMLFLSKVWEPTPNDEYSLDEMLSTFNFVLHPIHKGLRQIMLMPDFSPSPAKMKRIKAVLIKQAGIPQFKKFLEKSGLKFELFED